MDPNKAIVDQILAARGLGEEQERAVREAVRLIVSRYPTMAIDRGAMLTIPYEERAEPTLAPMTGDSHPPEPTTGPITAGGERVPTSELVAVGLLGHGGMGEVHRARDNTLDRYLAMKLLHGRLSSDHRMRNRFLAEATITAQLAHPGIPPVHQLGESDDGRPFFTMKEVHGRTLGDVIREFHRPGGSEWTESRLLDIFHRVCEAVAYAHSRGVIHCDLKPANIMVGAFGEVLVMDWGVARVVEPAASESSTEPPVSGQWAATLDEESTVAGTPAYMPPEQATGEMDQLGPPSDVFALGVILYEMLTGGRPFRGDIMRIVRAVTMGAIPPLEARPGSLMDSSLEAIIRKCLAASPEDRFPDAAAMAREFGRWKEGSLKREAALKIVRQAQAMLPDVEPRRERARALREMAEQRLAELDSEATATEKATAWSLLDEAAGLDLDVAMKTTEVAQLLQGALLQAPDLPEARKLLAQLHFEHHQVAESRRDRLGAVEHEMRLREYDVGDYADYLAGTATLTLVTDPPCQVLLHSYAEVGRQLVPREHRSLGRTPLIQVELPIGSYMLELRAEARPTVWYPVQLGRLEHWTAAAPSSKEPTPLYLPEPGEVGEDEVYVPGGWTRLGGDAQAPGSPRESRVWVDGFAMRVHPVTAREIYAWAASNDHTEARRELLRATGGLWHPDWPALGVSWGTAQAYARWVSEQTGVRWRLPTEAEWEKAARGVDARRFPWGDFGDEAFCHIRVGRALPQMPEPVGSTTSDRSPYGVHGMAGNAREWCLDPFRPGAIASIHDRRAVIPRLDTADVLRAVRGGSWRQPLEAARCAARSGLPADQGHADVTFRLVRSLGCDTSP